jgi:hypothetical protein
MLETTYFSSSLRDYDKSNLEFIALGVRILFKVRKLGHIGSLSGLYKMSDGQTLKLSQGLCTLIHVRFNAILGFISISSGWRRPRESYALLNWVLERSLLTDR